MALNFKKKDNAPMDFAEEIDDLAEIADAIAYPHDHFFKVMMSDPRVAREFLETYVPSSFLSQMNLETLSVCKGSFVDAQLKKSETDILLHMQVNGGSAYVYVLTELQRKVDHDMPYRMMQYKMRILEQHRRIHHDRVLPVIYTARESFCG